MQRQWSIREVLQGRDVPLTNDEAIRRMRMRAAHVATASCRSATQDASRAWGWLGLPGAGWGRLGQPGCRPSPCRVYHARAVPTAHAGVRPSGTSRSCAACRSRP